MQDFTASAGPQGCPLDELIAFLTTRLDEREARALAVLASTARSRESTGLGSTLWDEQDEDARRELREAGADRALLGLLDRAIRCRDLVFARPEPRSVSDEMRAVTQMLALEQVLRLRAAIWSDHQDYQAGW